ncbi:hypothetical protein BGS_0359 [Beggiatoa sp. SS]|nr:hypothetical protein BGS_0359 [Beggiatoa sp. SS]
MCGTSAILMTNHLLIASRHEIQLGLAFEDFEPFRGGLLFFPF